MLPALGDARKNPDFRTFSTERRMRIILAVQEYREHVGGPRVSREFRKSFRFSEEQTGHRTIIS
jgi:hypothetical protein